MANLNVSDSNVLNTFLNQGNQSKLTFLLQAADDSIETFHDLINQLFIGVVHQSEYVLEIHLCKLFIVDFDLYAEESNEVDIEGHAISLLALDVEVTDHLLVNGLHLSLWCLRDDLRECDEDLIQSSLIVDFLDSQFVNEPIEDSSAVLLLIHVSAYLSSYCGKDSSLSH